MLVSLMKSQTTARKYIANTADSVEMALRRVDLVPHKFLHLRSFMRCVSSEEDGTEGVRALG